MSQQLNPPCVRAHARRLSEYFTVLAVPLFAMFAANASAQATHIANPYAGATYTGMGFNGTWNGTTNAVPTSFAVNGTTCK